MMILDISQIIEPEIPVYPGDRSFSTLKTNAFAPLRNAILEGLILCSSQAERYLLCPLPLNMPGENGSPY